MLESLLNIEGLMFLARWMHLFFGIIWIGLLYYFNFVQGAYFAEAEASAKANAVQKLVPRALWWFRYGALWTWLFGFLMLMLRSHQTGAAGGGFASSYWINILTGSVLGTLMFLNVWGIIWRNQKLVIAGAPNAAAAGAKAALASRTNVLFSIPMLFFMIGANHLNYAVTETSNVMLYVILATIVILGLEFNGIKGKTGPMTTIKGVITCGFVLTAVFGALIAFTI